MRRAIPWRRAGGKTLMFDRYARFPELEDPANSSAGNRLPTLTSSEPTTNDDSKPSRIDRHSGSRSRRSYPTGRSPLRRGMRASTSATSTFSYPGSLSPSNRSLFPRHADSPSTFIAICARLANAERLLGTFCANANARHAAAARTSPREVDVSTTSAAAADEPDAAGHRARASVARWERRTRCRSRHRRARCDRRHGRASVEGVSEGGSGNLMYTCSFFTRSVRDQRGASHEVTPVTRL